jgi:hypothetical protein
MITDRNAPSKTGTPAAWRTARGISWGVVWLAIATVAAGLFFSDGLDALLRAWSRPEYSHGPLIPILSGLLFLRQLKEYPPEPGPNATAGSG